IKLGLAGCVDVADWVGRWRQRLAKCPAQVGVAAVVYADRDAAAPSAEDVLAAAIEQQAAVVLVDTYGKKAGNLLTHWSLRQAGQFVQAVQRAGLQVALAGSLDAPAIKRLLPLEPDYVAVRSAACVSDRVGSLDSQRLCQLVKIFRSVNDAA